MVAVQEVVVVLAVEQQQHLVVVLGHPHLVLVALSLAVDCSRPLFRVIVVVGFALTDKTELAAN